MAVDQQLAQFQLLSAVGASALSIWQLMASADQLQQLIPSANLDGSRTQVVLLRDGDGQVFDQALLWLRKDGTLSANGCLHAELHLHGGHGPAAALRRRLRQLGWVEMKAKTDPFLRARGSLNAKWLALPAPVRKRQLEQEAGRRWARVLELPPRIVLAGPPNSGKSTLFNTWLQHNRVTVSPHPGTTRDAVEAPILVPTASGNWQATLVDTAGIWNSQEELDRQAIAAAQLQLEQSWRVIWIVDGAAAAKSWEPLLPQIRSDDVVVVHKADLLPLGQIPPDLGKWNPLVASAQRDGRQCISPLEKVLTESLGPIPAVICA